MEDPNDIVKTILFRQSEHIKEFEDSYAQQKELLHLRSAQQIMEEVRYHTLNRDQPNERHKQFLEQYLWNRDQREDQYRGIITHIQEILNLPAPVADYSELTLEEIENRFISIGDRKAELETLYSSFPCDHIKMLLNKAHTGFHAKFLVPRERPNPTNYLERMGESDCSSKVFISAGLKDLQKFDESYLFYKEEIHLRNAHRALENVRYGNLNRDQRMVHYQEILDNLQKILELPAPIEDYSTLTLEETRSRMRSVGERSAEMDRLFKADEQFGLIRKVFNGVYYVLTAMIETLETTAESGKKLKLI